jgi:hypothetical protein
MGKSTVSKVKVVFLPLLLAVKSIGRKRFPQ